MRKLLQLHFPSWGDKSFYARNCRIFHGNACAALITEAGRLRAAFLSPRLPALPLFTPPRPQTFPVPPGYTGTSYWKPTATRAWTFNSAFNCPLLCACLLLDLLSPCRLKAESTVESHFVSLQWLSQTCGESIIFSWIYHRNPIIHRAVSRLKMVP